MVVEVARSWIFWPCFVATSFSATIILDAIFQWMVSCVDSIRFDLVRFGPVLCDLTKLEEGYMQARKRRRPSTTSEKPNPWRQLVEF